MISLIPATRLAPGLGSWNVVDTSDFLFLFISRAAIRNERVEQANKITELAYTRAHCSRVYLALVVPILTSKDDVTNKLSVLFILGDNENDDKKTGEEKPKELKICAKCEKKIEGKFLLRALDRFWHDECLKCSYCNTQLADLSFKFYLKGDLILCKRDYIR